MFEDQSFLACTMRALAYCRALYLDVNPIINSVIYKLILSP